MRNTQPLDTVLQQDKNTIDSDGSRPIPAPKSPSRNLIPLSSSERNLNSFSITIDSDGSRPIPAPKSPSRNLIPLIT